MSILSNIKLKNFTPYKGKVFVTDLEHGDRKTESGIILFDDNMSERGIRERWAKVWAVGHDVDDLAPGDWVLVKHGRWTERMNFVMEDGEVTVWMIDYPEAVVIVSDTDPRTTTHTKL